MTAPHAVVGTGAAPFMEAGLLVPDRGQEALARAIPALGAGTWRLADYHPLRFEVRDAVTLTGEVGLAPAGSPATRRVAFEASGASPEPGPWAGRDPVSGLGFRLSPADRRLPLLASILGPEPRTIPVPARDRAGEPDLVAHRFGRRAVLRVAGAGADRVWIKLWARDRAGRIADLHTRLAGASSGFRVARVRHHDPRGRLAAFEPLAGVPLHENLGAIEPAVGAQLASTVQAVSATDPGNLAPWGPGEERDNLRAFVRRAASVSRDRAARIAVRVAAFERDEPAPRFAGCGLIHRDLHDKQVLLGEGAPGILDWDLAAAGPPALDAGNLLAHFTLRALQMPACAERIRPVASGFVAAWLREMADEPALSWWTRIALLRLACVYTLRPGAGSLAESLLAATDAPLGLEGAS